MSATTISTPEGTSPVVAAPAATPAAPAPVDIKSIDLSKLDGATLKAALATASSQPEGEPAAPAAPDAYAVPDETPAPAPVAATPPAAEPAKPAEVPAAEAPKADDDEGDPLQGVKGIKIKPSNFKDWEVLRHMKPRDGQPPANALSAVIAAYGKEAVAQELQKQGYTAAQATAAVTAEPAKPAEAAPAPVAEAPALASAKSALAALETQLTKAQEDADLGAVTKLMREIGKAERAVERIEAESAAVAQSKADEATHNFRQREAAVAKEVYSVFPKLGDPASPEHAEFQSFVDLKFGDPDYSAIFTSPRWPKVLANEFAEAKGWSKAPAPASATGTPAPTPGAPTAPRVTQAEVLTPGSTQGGSGAIDARSALAALRAQGPEALFKALNSVSR